MFGIIVLCMSRYVVLRSGGKQYRVTEGETLDLQKIEHKDKEVTFDDILFYASDGEYLIGNPNVENVKVVATVIEDLKGEKIRVAKFKSKVRYRKVIGFRPLLTRIKIDKIVNNS